MESWATFSAQRVREDMDKGRITGPAQERARFGSEKEYVASVIGGDQRSSAFVDVHGTFDETCALAHRVIDMVSRLIGSSPEAQDAGRSAGISPEPSAMFDILRDDSCRTVCRVRDAQDALDRLERALP